MSTALITIDGMGAVWLIEKGCGEWWNDYFQFDFIVEEGGELDE